MNGEVAMRRRADRAEQKNRAKTESGDFLIIDRKKNEEREKIEGEKGKKTHFTTFASLQ